MSKDKLTQTHHCIFEINKETMKCNFVTEFGEDISSAEDFCESMNNFRTPNMPVYFCVRCLTQNEFDNIEIYNPCITSVMVTSSIKGNSI